jgi:recombinational DNA repair protein RecR
MPGKCQIHARKCQTYLWVDGALNRLINVGGQHIVAQLQRTTKSAAAAAAAAAAAVAAAANNTQRWQQHATLQVCHSSCQLLLSNTCTSSSRQAAQICIVDGAKTKLHQAAARLLHY